MILVTGGAGYIGSHTCVALLSRGQEVVIVDDLSNSAPAAVRRIAELAGRAPVFHHADVRDRSALDAIFTAHPIRAVLHFAGAKAVGESVTDPLSYYDNNVIGALRLLQAMGDHGVRDLVFSSSASVYGVPETLPLTEDAPTRPTSPYGTTKHVIEGLIRDVFRSESGWRATLLRYFNPIGAHPSGRLGEDPKGVPTNLVPYVARVALGTLPALTIHGDDWPTPDGTGVRDYLHVMDLAEGHLAALDHLSDLRTFNLGTGRGHSVREIVRAFEAASGRSVACTVGPRRDGDVATCVADPSAAARELGWRTRRSLQQMCADQWAWQRANPNGYPRGV